MVEEARDVDTAGMEEQLARSKQLIDEAKVTAAELAETNPDPYKTEAEHDEASGFETGGDTPESESPGATRATPGS